VNTGPTDLKTAAEIRAENARLDAELLTEAALINAARLGWAPEGEWSAAQVLAHLGEFPVFFAEQLRRWRENPDTVVGRTHEHPVRLAAVDSPAEVLSALTTGVQQAFATLVAALNELEDADITAATENVKYGKEPLSAFLDRYVLGHKAGHLDQLRSLRSTAP
jgi:hypothetical protein